MKISPKIYAETLLQSLQGKNKKEADLQVANFCKLVKKAGREKDFDSILENFSKLWDEKEGVKQIEIESAKELENDIENKVIEFAKRQYKNKKIVTTKKVNPKIIGGFILRSGDDLWDFSLKKRINNLKNNLK